MTRKYDTRRYWGGTVWLLAEFGFASYAELNSYRVGHLGFRVVRITGGAVKHG